MSSAPGIESVRIVGSVRGIVVIMRSLYSRVRSKIFCYCHLVTSGIFNVCQFSQEIHGIVTLDLCVCVMTMYVNVSSYEYNVFIIYYENTKKLSNFSEQFPI